MPELPDDICPAPEPSVASSTTPLAAPLFATSVWRCSSLDEAEALLDGHRAGYVYQRDAHPNADLLAAKCRRLHGAAEATICGSGMSAMALAVLSQLAGGDHVVASEQLYGRSLQLLTAECERLGIGHTRVDTCRPAEVTAACTERTRMIVVETIANPRLRVADLAGLADVARDCGAALLVDNTFATPLLCRPLEHGAHLVIESISKMINGHSDVMLGLLAGEAERWERVRTTQSVWGLAASPFDCWLAARGLATMALRVERACRNAQVAADFLAEHAEVERVDYPGLASHPDHELARRQFGGLYGTVVTFHLAGGRPRAERFIGAARRIPFCPSLGEVSTTLSHPESTSHRGLTPEQRQALGISGGTVRLSLGVESADHVVQSLSEASTAARAQPPDRSIALRMAR